MDELVYIVGLVVSLLSMVFLFPIIRSQRRQFNHIEKYNPVKVGMLVATFALFTYNLYAIMFDVIRIDEPRQSDWWGLTYTFGSYCLRGIFTATLYLIYKL